MLEPFYHLGGDPGVNKQKQSNMWKTYVLAKLLAPQLFGATALNGNAGDFTLTVTWELPADRGCGARCGVGKWGGDLPLFQMGLSENSVTQVLMVCHHISYWSGHTWGVLYFQTHPNDEKWWKWLELEITWTIHGTNFDFGWLPRLFHSTSARPAEEMRPVAASLPQAALPVYWGSSTSRRLGNRTAMAWQCSLVTGACYVYVDVGRWLLVVGCWLLYVVVVFWRMRVWNHCGSPMTCCHHWDILGYFSSRQVGKRRCTRRNCLQNVRRIRCFDVAMDGIHEI
jgi:hypothetical protein